MPPRMFSVEGTMGLRSSRYADGKANLRAVVAASSSIADGVSSALKPPRTRLSPYPAAAIARAIRISETTFQGFMSTSPVPQPTATLPVTILRPLYLTSDELLPAVNVVGCASESRVAHNVNSERGDVGWRDDASDGKRCAKLIATVV